MSDRLTVKANTTLMPFLTSQLKGWSRSTIKQRLKGGCVMVNGEQVTKHNHDLSEGDQVVVEAAARGAFSLRPQLDILYKDRDLIAINKPAGMLSVNSPQSKERHALGILRDQLSRRNTSIKLWPVHRIDRDTSGVLLFATSREMREAVMKDWKTAEKIYLAIVKGCPKPTQGTINQPLRPDPVIYQMHVGPHPDAKRAVTHFSTERSVGKRSLLRVELETGHMVKYNQPYMFGGPPQVKASRAAYEAFRDV